MNTANVKTEYTAVGVDTVSDGSERISETDSNTSNKRKMSSMREASPFRETVWRNSVHTGKATDQT